MGYTKLPERFAKFAAHVFESSRFMALVWLATLTLATLQPAQAQNADTWKSVAIIGGSTAAGAYIGHKAGGSKGALVGAGVGASVGYAIDRRRRQNEYYNQSGYSNDGYYGNDGGYYPNDGYYGPYDSGTYPAAYRSNSCYGADYPCSSRR